MNEETTIYVQLMGEGTVVYRPSKAIKIKEAEYRLLMPPGYDPNAEEWEFKPGTVVKGEIRSLSQGPALVAIAVD